MQASSNSISAEVGQETSMSGLWEGGVESMKEAGI